MSDPFFLFEGDFGANKRSAQRVIHRWGAFIAVNAMQESAAKFNTRYATFGFLREANLNEGGMWSTAIALKELTVAKEARIGALVKKAVS